MNLATKDWVRLLKREYLETFIASGGAAVKFVIPETKATSKELSDGLEVAAKETGFYFVKVDAAVTKLHMIDHLFYAVARGIDWRGLAHTFMGHLFKAKGYRVAENSERFDLRAIASANGREELFLRREVMTWLEREIFKDFQMSQEFRIAMIYLCRAQLDDDGGESLFESAIIEWLHGELTHVGKLKGVHIFRKIKRHNARHMLHSVARWLKVLGKDGLLLVIDASRYMVNEKPKSGEHSLYYGTVAVIDAYEVLRQFVDGTDEVENSLMVIVSTPEFLTDKLRGVQRYDALKLRIWGDVRDRNRPNPLAPLVRLESPRGSR